MRTWTGDWSYEFDAAFAELDKHHRADPLPLEPFPGLKVVADPSMAPGTFKLVSLSYRFVDPLDVTYDGVPLREMLERDENDRRELPVNFKRRASTPTQRAAVSAHWSAELRARIAAGKPDRLTVLVDL